MAGGRGRRAAGPKVGLALGGGGARGLAHIPVLEAFDEIGVVPHAIAGASIGAIIGAGYAAGIPGAALNAYVTALFRNRGDVVGRLWGLRPSSFRDFFAGGVTIGQFDIERILKAFLPELPATLEELRIPLTVIATDYYGWGEVALDRGPLIPAIAASAALPALFRPVTLDGRLMVDGGLTNPMPFDHLDRCDIVVAVDVNGGPVDDGGGKRPTSTDLLFAATQLTSQSITREKMRHSRLPEIVLRPPPSRFHVLDFFKSAAIIKAAEGLKDELKRGLEKAMADR